MIKLDMLWEEIKQELSAKMSALSYEVWILKLEPICFYKNQLVLLANSKSARQTINKNYLTIICEAVQEKNPTIENVIVITDDQKDLYLKQQDYILDDQFVVKDEVEVQKPVPSNSAFVKKYRFDNFVVGGSNKYACAAAQAAADSAANNLPIKNNPLFIYGGVGLGKTHIMHAIGNYIKDHNNQLKILYTTAEKVTNDLIESLKPINKSLKGIHNTPEEFREKYRNSDVLMIDDVQFLSRTTATQEAVFHMFNELYHNDKYIILSSDRPPKEIPSLEERLRTRFQMGLMVDIKPPDLETRIAILQMKAKQENFYLTSEVASFIAENVTDNIRDMEGLLNKVIFYSSLSGIQVTNVATAQEALRDYITINKESIDANDIINRTCQHFNLSKEDLIGKVRKKEIVEPRMIAIYLIRDILGIPLDAIGSMFGGRDHTTIMHSHNKIEELIKVDSSISVHVKDIRALLYNR